MIVARMNKSKFNKNKFRGFIITPKTIEVLEAAIKTVKEKCSANPDTTFRFVLDILDEEGIKRFGGAEKAPEALLCIDEDFKPM